MNCIFDLSVIVLVYGTEKYIDKCLTSALKAVEDISAEIIVVNDGTKDNAGIIAQKYSSEYPEKIFYFEKQNGGRADARNFGLEKANGRYIIYLDSDDYIDQEMYKEMLYIAKKDLADCVVCDIIYELENEKKSYYKKCMNNNRRDVFYSLADTALMASPCNKIMKKELFEGISFPVGKDNEDVAVIPIVLGKSNKTTYLPKGFYHYVQRSNSVQHSPFSKKRFVILDMCALALRRAKELTPRRNERLKDALYFHQIFAVLFWTIRRQQFSLRYKYCKSYMKKVERMFPDFHDNREIQEYATTGKRRLSNCYRKLCLLLNKHKQYFALCIIWSFYNRFKKE